MAFFGLKKWLTAAQATAIVTWLLVLYAALHVHRTMKAYEKQKVRDPWNVIFESKRLVYLYWAATAMLGVGMVFCNTQAVVLFEFLFLLPFRESAK